jgi:hypothetical protein
VYQQQQEQQQQEEQDAENPFLDPPFSRIKRQTAASKDKFHAILAREKERKEMRRTKCLSAPFPQARKLPR